MVEEEAKAITQEISDNTGNVEEEYGLTKRAWSTTTVRFGGDELNKIEERKMLLKNNRREKEKPLEELPGLGRLSPDFCYSPDRMEAEFNVLHPSVIKMA